MSNTKTPNILHGHYRQSHYKLIVEVRTVNDQKSKITFARNNVRTYLHKPENQTSEIANKILD